MATLVVTIKTEALKSNLEEVIATKTDYKFSPLTANIKSLGLYDIECRNGAVYLVSDDEVETGVGDWRFKSRTENELLEDFWEGALSYDTFVTFNGRSFTMPFLLHRSVANEIRPTVEIARQRYLTKQSLPYHVDLLDELTMYGGMNRSKLSEFCELYGTARGDGVSEGAVGFRSETNRALVTETVDETIAIAGLYEKWLKYLAPYSFINKVEF